MPVRQRKTVTRGEFAEHQFEVSNLFVYVLVTHLMFPQKWPGNDASGDAFEPIAGRINVRYARRSDGSVLTASRNRKLRSRFG